VIPVMDLRLKFGMPAMDYTDRTCIIVVEIDTQDMTIQIGIVVDSVSEVLNIQEEEMEHAPSFGTQVDTAYILGMAKIDSGVKILLDIDKVLNADEIYSINELA
jgi:purine-binding chemotaxis protein CheW